MTHWHRSMGQENENGLGMDTKWFKLTLDRRNQITWVGQWKDGTEHRDQLTHWLRGAWDKPRGKRCYWIRSDKELER